MENQSPSSIANSALSRRSDAPDERDTEIAKLRERLGFYESFDQIIQENVARAGDLFRHAVSARESADAAVSTATKELEQRRISDRQEQRALLSGLLDDVTTMQVHVERLARKVADALDDIEASLPAGPDLDFLPSSAGEPLVALVAPVEDAVSEIALDPTPEEIAPEDLSVIAARLAADNSPIEVETAAMASELAEYDSALSFEAAVATAEVAFDTEEPPVSEVVDALDIDVETDLQSISVEDEGVDSNVEQLDLHVPEAEAPGITADDSADEENLRSFTEDDLLGASIDTEIAGALEDRLPDSLEVEATDVPGEEDLPDLLAETESSPDFEPVSSEALVNESGVANAETEDEIEVSEVVSTSEPELASPEPEESAEIESGESIETTEDDVISEDDLSFSAGEEDTSDEPSPASESDIPAIEFLEEEPDYPNAFQGNMRSLSTDELFLAVEAIPAADLTTKTDVVPPVPTNEIADSVANWVEASTPESVDVSIEDDGTQSDSLEEVAVGDDGVISTFLAESDVADAETVIGLIESTNYQPAAPAALAEDPAIDAALSESLAHAEHDRLAIEDQAESPVGGAAEVADKGVSDAPAAQDSRPFPAGGLGSSPRPSTAELRNAALSRFTSPAVPTGIRGIGTVVLVHGVPRATTALSLKRFLESLPHVSSVEPREYAEGILRLHVTADRAIHIDDLRGWSDGAGFEPVHLRDDLVEVRLPH